MIKSIVTGGKMDFRKQAMQRAQELLRSNPPPSSDHLKRITERKNKALFEELWCEFKRPVVAFSSDLIDPQHRLRTEEIARSAFFNFCKHGVLLPGRPIEDEIRRQYALSRLYTWTVKVIEARLDDLKPRAVVFDDEVSLADAKESARAGSKWMKKTGLQIRAIDIANDIFARFLEKMQTVDVTNDQKIPGCLSELRSMIDERIQSMIDERILEEWEYVVLDRERTSVRGSGTDEYEMIRSNNDPRKEWLEEHILLLKSFEVGPRRSVKKIEQALDGVRVELLVWFSELNESQLVILFSARDDAFEVWLNLYERQGTGPDVFEEFETWFDGHRESMMKSTESRNWGLLNELMSVFIRLLTEVSHNE